eukprot:2070042-Pyramimonas_sp.AAC.1
MEGPDIPVDVDDIIDMPTYKRDDEWKVLTDTQYSDKRAFPNINAANETAMENNGWEFEYEQQR